MVLKVPTNFFDPRMLTDEELFCLEGCRGYKQYYNMRQGFESGACAFCTINPELNIVVWEDQFMRVWHVHPNFMRPELKLHILIVPIRHVRFMGDLSIAEWVSLGSATEFAKKHYGYTGGLFHAREGDMRNNAGTVPHLHINIFEPNGTGEMRVPVFKDIADRAENQARARQFSGQYGLNVTPDQFNQMVKAGLMNEDGYTT